MSEHPGYLRYFMALLQAALIGGAVAWALNLPTRLGLALYTEQLLIAGLGLALALAFLNFRWRAAQTGSAPWYDQLLAVLSLAVCGYLAVRYPELVRELIYRPLDGVILAGVLVALLIEAVRRTSGIVLVLIVLFFFAYGLLGHMLPGDYAIRPVSLSRMLVYLGIDTSGIIGAPLAVAVIIITPFLLLGQLLSRSGGADFFTSLSMALMGRHRGGAAKISVIGSTFFGAISGSAVANVASTGVITIPLMQRGGFPARLAAGVEAVASTGGQLMPPVMGASAFLMAEFLQISYGQVMLAAIIPAVLYYAALFIQVDLRAARLGLEAVPEDRIPDTLKVLREGWYFPLPFAVFLAALFWLNWRPELAVLVASVILAVAAMLFGYQGKRIDLKDVWASVLATGRAAVDIVVICAAAGLVIGILNLTGLAFSLSLQLIALSGDSLIVLLVLAAAISIVLGMGMPTVGVYVLLAALVAPALTRAGVEPLVAHFFVLYFGMLSMVTPPIALAAFTAANIAKADFWETGWSAVQLGWSAYIIPFLFVASPALLMIGSPLLVLWTVVTALVGITFVSVAIAGYLRTSIGVAARLTFAASGLLVMVPANAWSGAVIGEFVGLAVGGSLAAYLLLAAGRAPLAATGRP